MSKRLDSELWREIGGRLRQLRGDKSTTDFLMEHRLSPRIPWNSVEIGSRGFDVQTLIEICTAIDISLDWLVLGKNKDNVKIHNETETLLTGANSNDTASRLHRTSRLAPRASEVIQDAIGKQKEFKERQEGKHGATLARHESGRKRRS